MLAPHHTPSGTPMFGELAGYEAQLDRLDDVARALLDGLDDARFNWRPAPNRWSIAENIDHLRLIGAQYRPAIDDAIAAGQARSMYAEGPFRFGIVERLMEWTMEPPVRLRLRAPRAITPAPARPLADAEREYFTWHADIRERIGRANGLDLASVKIRSPLVRGISLSLGKAFGILLAHERRHLWQAQGVRTALDGKAAGP